MKTLAMVLLGFALLVGCQGGGVDVGAGAVARR